MTTEIYVIYNEDKWYKEIKTKHGSQESNRVDSYEWMSAEIGMIMCR